MDNPLGVLRVKIIRGINLAIRDCTSSDPYVVLKWGKQKLKTSIVKKNLNPVWNEDLTLCVLDPTHPIHLTVYDHDTFNPDDKMGVAEIDIRPFTEAVQMHLRALPDGAIVRNVIPTRTNFLAEESKIHFHEGKLVQDIILRLSHVESGEIELQLQWVDIPVAQQSHHHRRH